AEFLELVCAAPVEHTLRHAPLYLARVYCQLADADKASKFYLQAISWHAEGARQELANFFQELGDMNQAAHWFVQTALREDSRYCSNETLEFATFCLETGAHEVPKSPVQLAELYKKGARKGDQEAGLKLTALPAKLMAAGESVPDELLSLL